VGQLLRRKDKLRLLILLATMCLASCNTVHGFGKDVQVLGKTISGEEELLGGPSAKTKKN
jgi:predicted small secreted protein